MMQIVGIIQVIIFQESTFWFCFVPAGHLHLVDILLLVLAANRHPWKTADITHLHREFRYFYTKFCDGCFPLQLTLVF